MTMTKDKSECGVEEEAQPVEIPVVNSGACNDELRTEEPERSRECDGEEIFGALLLHVLGNVDVAAATIELTLMLDPPSEEYAVSSFATVYQRSGHDSPEAPIDGKQSPEDISPTPMLSHKRHHEEPRRRPARGSPKV